MTSLVEQKQRHFNMAGSQKVEDFDSLVTT